MIDPTILRLIQCPLDGQALQLASPVVITTLNQLIATKSLRDRTDQLVTDSLDAGLITQDGARLYPIRGGIPTLVVDGAIELSGVETLQSANVAPAKSDDET
ncbi:Trm112 family protein [Roseiconus nitratireducens]|uniref:Trm112 family protein n=1 Tax=Roseiconus nitratireducens TaxID=2605748 RepID=A0A5M6D0F7_9BACT|nr:Trm112 family protein [Roseiconus nitratireducens]KAA5540968.1 Trm112 family protein [Roseiconus nitratireducens]